MQDNMNASKAKRQKVRQSRQNVETEETDDYLEVRVIPSYDDSGESDSDSDPENVDSDQEVDHSHSPALYDIPTNSYHTVLGNYTENQLKLEPDHVFEWLDGEKKCNEVPENILLISTYAEMKIRNSSFIQLFECFFSTELKEHIIEATKLNGYNLTMDELNIFIGIIITSIFNPRKSQRDYWASNRLLACEPIASAMSRLKFEVIKSKLKLSKPDDKNAEDRAWRVRTALEIFKKNSMQFGFFSSALSVDEMMVKFNGRTILKQFMKDKPVRFGIKMWAICSVNGFLFDCDIYCGKGSRIFSSDKEVKLSKCSVGSRVVLQMVQNLLSSVVPRKITQYHLYFDNFFSNPDLLVHLRKVGLRATGTVRANRVGVSNEMNKQAKRGTFTVKHDKNSGINFITVMDSKPVSLLSTMASVTPLSSVKRYSKEEKQKTDIPFPTAFTVYNKFMGGVDLHDAHCSNLMPSIRSKKWTWAIFMRLIQSSIANATVLRNQICHETKVGTKEVALQIAEKYLERSSNCTTHKIQTVTTKRNCINFNQCSCRTQKKCTQCNNYICSTCLQSNKK